MQFDTKLGHVIYKIRRIPFDCAEFTSMIDKPRIHGLSPQQQLIYQPVTD